MNVLDALFNNKAAATMPAVSVRSLVLPKLTAVKFLLRASSTSCI